MTQFILLIVIMVSLAAVLFLAAKALPRIDKKEEEKKPNFLERWITSEIPYRFDKFLGLWLEKLFRKLKVVLLKIDNFLTERLKKMNSEEQIMGNKFNPKGDIKEVVAEELGIQVEEEKK